MALVVVAYSRAGWSRPCFDLLAHAKERGGYLFSMAAAALAGGAAPEVLKIVFFQRFRPTKRNLAELAFAMPFWAEAGLTVDILYRAQNVWFGSGVNFSTLAAKVFIDQFVYNPFYAAPTMTWAYEWRNRGFRLHANRDMFTAAFYVSRVIPTLLATWGVWIPLVALIYSLPPLLQTPLFSLALTFWALMVAFIMSSRRDGAAAG